MPIHFSSEQLDRAAIALKAFPGGVEAAAAPAMNRAVLAAKTLGIRKLAATYTAKRRTVSDTVRISRATRANLSAGFSSAGNRLPLMAFKVRPAGRSSSNRTLSVMVRRDSGGNSISRGFVNAVKGGRLAVLQREGVKRYPIRGLFGPAAPQMFGEEGVREEIESRGTEVLGRRFEHEVGRILERMLS